MTFAEKNSHTVANGVTAVDALASPASSHTSVMRNLIVNNRDTVAHVVIVQLVDSTGPTTTRLVKLSLDPDATLTFAEIVVLDSTTKKVQVVLGEAMVTTNPDINVAYGDVS